MVLWVTLVGYIAVIYKPGQVEQREPIELGEEKVDNERSKDKAENEKLVGKVSDSERLQTSLQGNLQRRELDA